MPVKKRRKRNTRELGPWEPDTRDMQIYALVSRGQSQKKVAAKFDLSPTSIHFITKKIDGWLAPQLMSQIREIKAGHTSRLMHIYQEAMAAWEKSKRMEEIEIEKNASKNPGTDYKRRYPVGNPAYLDQARAALDQIRDIWGANAPLQIEHSGEVRVAGQNVTEARNLLMERLQKLTAVNQN